MAPKSIKGNADIAKKIKDRRNELNLTIEEAASIAGIGTKTWCRYEAGESIRKDKYKGICKALKWRFFLDEHLETDTKSFIKEYKNHYAWSTVLAECFGDIAAASFAVGSDLLLDKINQDLEELSTLPQNTHIGQLQISFTKDILPPQFLMHYDYEFLYLLKSSLIELVMRAHNNCSMYAHSVLQEIIIYTCVEEAKEFVLNVYDEKTDNNWNEWVFDLFDDCDVTYLLYSDKYISKDNIYHFSYWNENQFYTD